MQIVVKNSAGRIAALSVAIVVFVVLVTWVGRAYLAGVIGDRPAIANYQTASHLDPGNSSYALSLGRMYEYTVANADPARALSDLTRAVQLNPYNAQAWLDLATAFEFQGNNAKAEACMRRADALRPRAPNFQWAIGNFFLLRNNVNEAFRHFKAVLSADPGYETEIFNIAWKASGNAGTILSEVVPDRPGPDLDYLNYLVAGHRMSDAAAVWNRIEANPEKFPPNYASYYIDVLIMSGQPEQAYKVWMTLRAKGLIPSTDEATSRNLVENGDFENPLLGFGFGWRVAAVNGVYVGLDDNTYHSATKALMIVFPGNRNVDYHNIYQFVPVLPAHHYRLTAFMKADGVTTDSGPRLEVKDAFAPARLDKYSDQLKGSTPSWMPLSIDFDTSPQTRLVVVGISRPASQLFGGEIAGRVWVDDVTLTATAK
ncbi:MAG: tetratricopeptide repeat protein [Terriglobia bacterium]